MMKISIIGQARCDDGSLSVSFSSTFGMGTGKWMDERVVPMPGVEVEVEIDISESVAKMDVATKDMVPGIRFTPDGVIISGHASSDEHIDGLVRLKINEGTELDIESRDGFRFSGDPVSMVVKELKIYPVDH
jgi:hypothetical protein